MTVDVFEIVVRVWMASITILWKNTPFIGKLQCQREEANKQNHYAVVIVKWTAECTENQGSCHGTIGSMYSSQRSGNIKCIITSDSPRAD